MTGNSAVADRPPKVNETVGRKKDTGDDDKLPRGPGRAPASIVTKAFCARVPVALIAAFERLAVARSIDEKSDELKRAAEQYLDRWYKLLTSDPDNPLLDLAGRQAVKDFVAAAEAYYRQVGRTPPKT
jgi:hypothetical protein